jgi:hypothetical protein
VVEVTAALADYCHGGILGAGIHGRPHRVIIVLTDGDERTWKENLYWHLISRLRDLFEVAAARNFLALYKITYVMLKTVDGYFVASA